jgi:CMP-N,N'-diacetyllegionaminic acid synthase
MKLLTIIPARGGSKGVPGKNRRPVNGKPLISWTIECALKTDGLDRILVSSDDPEILAIASSYERIVVRRRPEHLARDATLITDVITHLLDEEETEGRGPYDAILLLQPTAPIREPRHIEEALLALVPGVNSVISVVPMQDMHPARMYELGDAGILKPMIPALETARRQDIPAAYYRNGSIYLVRTDAFRSQHAVMAKPAVAYPMDPNLMLNIDEPRDILVAGPLIAAWQEGRL